MPASSTRANLDPTERANTGVRARLDAASSGFTVRANGVDDVHDLRSFAEEVGARVTTLVEKHLETVADGHVVTMASPDAVADAVVDIVIGHASASSERNDVMERIAPLWSAQRARRALALSRTTMSERRRTGSLLAVRTTDGDFFYPVSQFESRDGKIQVKPSLRPFMMALRERDPWTVALLLHTPAPELNGLTPLDWVRRRRDGDTLLGYAEGLNAEYEH